MEQKHTVIKKLRKLQNGALKDVRKSIEVALSAGVDPARVKDFISSLINTGERGFK